MKQAKRPTLLERVRDAGAASRSLHTMVPKDGDDAYTTLIPDSGKSPEQNQAETVDNKSVLERVHAAKERSRQENEAAKRDYSVLRSVLRWEKYSESIDASTDMQALFMDIVRNGKWVVAAEHGTVYIRVIYANNRTVTVEHNLGRKQQELSQQQLNAIESISHALQRFGSDNSYKTFRASALQLAIQ